MCLNSQKFRFQYNKHIYYFIRKIYVCMHSYYTYICTYKVSITVT